MKTQNDINKQFSANNNSVFASFVAMLGTFLSAFYFYIEVAILQKGILSTNRILFVTLLVIIVLGLLACISVELGYARRRDHVVACASDPNDPFPKICSDGDKKCCMNYLLGVYKVLYPFFLLALVLFTIYAAIGFCGYSCYMIWTIVLGAVSFLSAIVFNCKRYQRYTEIVSNAKKFNPVSSDFTSDNSNQNSCMGVSSVVNRNITISIN